MTGPSGSGFPGRTKWMRLALPAAAGAGLFLAGALLGAILAVSLTLYRARTEPALPTSLPAGVTHAPIPSPPPTPPSSPTPTSRPVGPGVGQEAPPFTLPGLDGREVALASYRGRPVLLHFWASWCPPCREEWPAWSAFALRPAAGEVAILAVNVGEPPEVVRHFLGQETPPFPVLLDADGQVKAQYRVRALPMTFFLDAEGVVRRVVPGPMRLEALERLVRD